VITEAWLSGSESTIIRRSSLVQQLSEHQLQQLILRMNLIFLLRYTVPRVTFPVLASVKKGPDGSKSNKLDFRSRWPLLVKGQYCGSSSRSGYLNIKFVNQKNIAASISL